MTESDYNRQIIKNQQKITNSQQQIKKLEDDILQLKQLKNKFIILQNKIRDTANQTVGKVDSWDNLFGILHVKLNIGFFSNLLNVIKGSEYQSAYNGLLQTQQKIQTKIDALYREIEKNQAIIKTSRVNVEKLSDAKTIYLTQKAQTENIVKN